MRAELVALTVILTVFTGDTGAARSPPADREPHELGECDSKFKDFQTKTTNRHEEVNVHQSTFNLL